MRAFAGGGPKIPAIDPKITDFDVVVVGGLNSTILMKNLQENEHIKHLHPKMALVTEHGLWMQPQAYIGVVNSAVQDFKMESGSITS